MQFALKVIGAIALWIIGRRLIHFAVKMLVRTLKWPFDQTVAGYIATAASVLAGKLTRSPVTEERLRHRAFSPGGGSHLGLAGPTGAPPPSPARKRVTSDNSGP